jgi:cob(I)alamin adenosyltransferase
MRKRLTRITTRGGDRGQSGLADGTRHPKTAPQFAALGDIDELNSAIGVVESHLDETVEIRATLIELQSRLFDLGGAIAMPGTRLSMVDDVAALDGYIAKYNANLAPLANFVLPGGTPAGAHMHLARTICRRAERSVWALLESNDGAYDASIGVYLNRLSDALFVFARTLNLGSPEVLWRQRAPRL